ncbi:hypothetical protein [Pseudoxanthomonas japonensis]|uniref:Uncharacterized protein n=1 Tax=Pseudoxanthomonas japonensis TaxID=69284 RepID=A0ABQ6ZFI1_9GAMM|nr:hypothetical protein [Pseudoxanthomonas japonensis]KAF1724329.1 hypothetical protein CSC78_12605 [Pseudoxanthomonas japonensis]
MSKSSDFGNFILLVIGAGVAGVLFGNWAFTAVLYIGIGVMVLGTILYILNAMGVDLNARPERLGRAPMVSRDAQIAAQKVQQLLAAVDAKDGQSIERLVLQDNVSPFEYGSWEGEALSANTLATQQHYESAIVFFKSWSASGATARFKS